MTGLGTLLSGLLGSDEAAGLAGLGDGELPAEGRGIGVVGGDLLGHVLEHAGGGLVEQLHGGGFGAGASGFLVEVAVFEVAGLAVEVLAEQAVEGAHVEGLEEVGAGGTGFFQGQDDVLEAVVGVGLGQGAGQLDEVGGVGLFLDAERVDEGAQDDDEQLDDFALAEAVIELEELGGGQGLGRGEADADVGEHGAQLGGGAAGQGASRSGLNGSQ